MLNVVVPKQEITSWSHHQTVRDGFCSLLCKRGLKKRSSGLCCVYVPKEIPFKAAGRKHSIYFWMPVAWLFVDCHKDAFWGELQLQCSSPVFQVPLYTLKAINSSSVTQACDFCYVFFFNNATKIILSSHNELWQTAAQNRNSN